MIPINELIFNGLAFVRVTTINSVLMTVHRTIRIDFEKAEHASIVQQATSVEPELRPTLVSRTAKIEDNTLVT